jgi:hypothetical protein
MKKVMMIFVLITVLLSGCISGGNKYGSNRIDSNVGEYDIDNPVEEDDSGILQTDYRSLDLNNKNPNVQNAMYNMTATYKNNTTVNKTRNIVDNIVVNESLESIK